MNEKITKGNEMIFRETDAERVSEIILENMLRTRPEKPIYYKPCKKQKGVGFERPLGGVLVDFNEIYPDAEEGDFAYFEFDIIPMHDLDVLLNVKGEAEIEYNEKPLALLTEKGTSPESAFSFGFYNIPITVTENGKNRVRFKCVKRGGVFGAQFNLSIKRYPGMWANDYLYWMRHTIGEGELKGEEGVLISKLFKKGEEPSGISFKEAESESVFYFDKLSESGDTAYVYTVCKNKTKLCLCGTVSAVFINGEKATDRECNLLEGDTLLIECKAKDGEWYLKLDGDDFYLPFLKSERKSGINAVCLTGFSDENKWDEKYLDFKTVVKYGENESFWRFADGSYLRIYLDSVFYGQWFYALMVGFYGIRESGNKEYFWKNMKVMADYFDYISYDARLFGMPAFMPRGVEIDNLDATGSMGMNFVDAYNIKPDEKIADMIEYLADCIENNIPEFPDGTYYRVSTMWADDTYMSVPFIVRLYKHTGDKKWLIEARNQLFGFKKRLWMEDKKIFSHIYYVEDEEANRVPWARGNGWVMWTLSEMLLFCDDEEIKSEILKFYREYADGVRALQMDNGMWHQVMDRDDEESYPETSGTAMFALSLARGVNNGWLDEGYKDCIKKAWSALLENSIDKDGNIYGVSMGSGLSKKAEYYFKIDTAMNDDHGTGVILAAAKEIAML